MKRIEGLLYILFLKYNIPLSNSQKTQISEKGRAKGLSLEINERIQKEIIGTYDYFRPRT